MLSFIGSECGVPLRVAKYYQKSSIKFLRGSGSACGPKDLPFQGTIYRSRNKEPSKGRSFRLQVGLGVSILSLGFRLLVSRGFQVQGTLKPSPSLKVRV